MTNGDDSLTLYTIRDTSFHEFMLDVILLQYGFMTVSGEWYEAVHWELVEATDSFRWDLRRAKNAGVA